ncbi:ABC-type polar amino acid transport system, ATPase component (apicoplast) [Babesia ovis]|uniref:ABC-type polar amino acid transport system, ATPase component n=1 Tax=Babesia ovis TaxID=5869 RepID=A0A9W5TFB2_BABOV|nr:ABC-type polar amino acid transport system, ATPase component [Babesia ovis]
MKHNYDYNKFNIKYYEHFNLLTYYKIYKNFFLKPIYIKKVKNNQKKTYCKYNFNLLNISYAYSYHYLAKYIYRNVHQIVYMKDSFIKNNNNVNTIVLYYNKLFVKSKQKKEMKYDVIIGSGSSRHWVGVGSSKNSMYKKACEAASNQSKKYIYNLKLAPDDYKTFKYKNYKFSILDKSPNKVNFNIYNDITTLSGIKKLKLISYTKAKPKTILRAILHYFN